MTLTHATDEGRARASRQFQLLLLILAGLLIVGSAFFSATTIGKLRDSVQWVTHTLTVKHAIEELNSASHDVDTFGLRYLLSMEPDQLRAHVLAIEEVTERRGHLRELLVDSPEQLERLRQVQLTLEERDTWFRRAIGQTQEAGNALVTPQVLGGGSAQLTAQLRDILQQIENHENNLLSERQQALESVLTQGSVTVLMVNGLALVMACVALLLLRRGARDQQTRREIELRALEAERSTREKSEFLASMSHEIRTPMNAVLGFSQLLSRTRIEPQAQEYLRAIRTSGEALLALINDILDLSKIEAGKLSLSPQPVDIRELVDSTMGVFSEAANRKGLGLRTRADPEVPRTLTVDPHRLRQVLMNLLSNAVKYTDQGEVELVIQAERRDDRHADLLFRVRDTGRGIPEQAQATLFEPFHRAVPEADQETGSGLGLVIVRKLSHLLGGEVDFKSAPGRGSEFVVRLSNARVDEQPEGARQTFDEGVSFSRIRPSRILIVDDVVWNRDLLSAFLGEGEHQLAFATNGEEAIASVRVFQPDLVLMDLRMPVLDGREATRRIRSELGESAPALIAISASSMSREERDLGTLFDGYIRKPIARALLFHALAEHLGTVEDPTDAEQPDARNVADAVGAHAALDAESRQALQVMRDETLPRLQRSLRSAEVRRFADELTELADRHQLPGLGYYAERLRGAVERFDVNLMQSMLAQGEAHLSEALDETQ